MVPIPASLQTLLHNSTKLGEIYLVGGCVRDALLGRPQKDFDLEVYGIDYADLAAELARFGRVDLVGRSFGVVKWTPQKGETLDFNLPRRDSKTGPGHKGFSISFDPGITPQEAASRRDFTINAIMIHARSGEMLDFFGGRDDLAARVLRHTSPAFGEDPLRVLRGMQFAARFGLTAAPATLDVCRQISGGYKELAVERVREEWWKWAEKSARPSLGLRFLADAGWLGHFPELEAIREVPQDPEWHPEGDVFTHTLFCCDALAELPEWKAADEESRGVYMLAILTHDLGKAETTTTELRQGRTRIVSPGHEHRSVDLAESFLARIDMPRSRVDRVLPLVANHMIPRQPMSDRAIRRLSHRLRPENIQGLCQVITADASGRPPLPAGRPPMAAHLLAKAEVMKVHDSAPRPILLGRHLLELGLVPGPSIGGIVHRAYDAQLEGHFHDLNEAWGWLESTEAKEFEGGVRAALAAKNPVQKPGSCPP